MVKEPPVGSDWVHESKFDGYRLQAHVRGKKVKFWTRNAKDWADRFPTIVRTLRERGFNDALFDGEVVWLDKTGRSDFQRLQNAIKGGQEHELVYYVFDLLRLDGRDLRMLPLQERKKILRDLVGTGKNGESIRYSEHSRAQGEELLHAACRHRLEGLVSKRLTSPYPIGRNGDWVKSKCIHQQEFVIGGFTAGSGSRVGFGALLLGVFEAGQLRYVGKVGTGFTNASLRELKKL